MEPIGWKPSLALALLSLAFWIVTLSVQRNRWIDAVPSWIVGTAVLLYSFLAVGRYLYGPEWATVDT